MQHVRTFFCIQHNGIVDLELAESTTCAPEFFSPMADGTQHASLEEHFSGLDKAFLVILSPGMNALSVSL
jgi:hypothetical protein